MVKRKVCAANFRYTLLLSNYRIGWTDGPQQGSLVSAADRGVLPFQIETLIYLK
ncbi:hypothetical protein VDG1235_3888 [Verrucomicrobiia bacterium DG1235]|nr:hypothetical protein VDG1235_3888 [Verrucomicrobiae bacterium DG1235]